MSNISQVCSDAEAYLEKELDQQREQRTHITSDELYTAVLCFLVKISNELECINSTLNAIQEKLQA